MKFLQILLVSGILWTMNACVKDKKYQKRSHIPLRALKKSIPDTAARDTLARKIVPPPPSVERFEKN